MTRPARIFHVQRFLLKMNVRRRGKWSEVKQSIHRPVRFNFVMGIDNAQREWILNVLNGGCNICMTYRFFAILKFTSISCAFVTRDILSTHLSSVLTPAQS